MLTNSTRSEAQFTVRKYARFDVDPQIPHDQSLKRVIKYLKGTSTQGLIMKTKPENGIKFKIYYNFAVVCNQDKVADPVSVLSIMC